MDTNKWINLRVFTTIYKLSQLLANIVFFFFFRVVVGIS